MRAGTTNRSTPDDGPLIHAVRGEMPSKRRDRRRYAAYCGTVLPNVGWQEFRRDDPRACARCVTALGPEPVRP